MICPSCGYNAEPNAQFCSRCGRPLTAVVPPPASGPMPLGRLVRPREGRVIAGICAGFAVQYGWDVTIVRLVVVIAALFTGVPLIAYLIAWVVMPNAQYMLPPQAGPGPGSIVS